MIARRARVIALWSLTVALALWIVVHARYITDLSAFLPAKPTPAQQLLVDQLKDGPASRLILIALEQGDAGRRARVCAAMARRLRQDPQFAAIDDGEPVTAERDQDFLFRHRYLLSDAVTPRRFSVDGLRAALEDTVENLASSEGFMLKSLVTHDPTGEMLRLLDRLARRKTPRTLDGVWMSADGARTLMVAQTAAGGSDTDAQQRALRAVQGAFDAAVGNPAADPIRMRMSGPGVFAVAARAKIQTAATRLSIVSSILVIGVLLTVYRSLQALLLGLLPVATGALCGIAAVAVVFGSVHGVTLGFGITLIGESVDYSIYFFIQAVRHAEVLRHAAHGAPGEWQRALWPTVRLGMLTSVCGFASLLPSGFPGLAQLGVYSISGLIGAALVTRFVLPEMLPRRFAIRDVSPLGRRLAGLRDLVLRRGRRVIVGGACILAAVAVLALYAHRATLWNRELAALSPVAAADQRYDARLRADLGAANVLDLVIVRGSSLEAVLEGAEQAGVVLESLIDGHVIAAFDTPATFLPSLAAQRPRRDALPDKTPLRDNLQRAAAGLDLQTQRFAPFLDDIDAARRGGFVTAEDLRGTSLALGFATLILHQGDRWSALLPLHALPPVDGTAPDIDLVRVRAAFAAARLTDLEVLDLKAEADALYGSYLREALHLSLAGFALIVVLLLSVLRSAARVARVLAPLVLAVLSVAAGLVSCGVQLTILHLVGMLLIVAVGSNYALFFDRQGTGASDAEPSLTLSSLAIANLSTVIGFGLLSFSQVPVLEALGTTVAPGTFLALIFAALMTSRSLAAAHA
jgi:predicted exporter